MNYLMLPVTCKIMFYVLYNHYKYIYKKSNRTTKIRFNVEYTTNTNKFAGLLTLLLQKNNWNNSYIDLKLPLLYKFYLKYCIFIIVFLFFLIFLFFLKNFITYNYLYLDYLFYLTFYLTFYCFGDKKHKKATPILIEPNIKYNAVVLDKTNQNEKILILIYKVYKVLINKPEQNLFWSVKGQDVFYKNGNLYHKNTFLENFSHQLYSCFNIYKKINNFENLCNFNSYVFFLNFNYNALIQNLYIIRLLNKYSFINKTLYGDLLKYTFFLKYFNTIKMPLSGDLTLHNLFEKKNTYQAWYITRSLVMHNNLSWVLSFYQKKYIPELKNIYPNNIYYNALITNATTSKCFTKCFKYFYIKQTQIPSNIFKYALFYKKYYFLSKPKFDVQIYL